MEISTGVGDDSVSVDKVVDRSSILSCEISSVTRENHDVIIIGGGVSGLAAAARLNDHGVSDIKILEARNRLGGRVVAIDLDGVKLQLGATWIHGVLGNPIYELAVKHNLVSSIRQPPVHNMVACRHNGCKLPFHLVQEVYETYSCFLNRCCDYYLSGSEPSSTCPGNVLSVGDHLQLEIDIYLSQIPANERPIRRALFEHLMNRETVISGCHSMQEVDLASFGSYCELPGGNVIPQGGLSALLTPLKNRIHEDSVLLRHAVSRITVHQESDEDASIVLVDCENGAQFSANRVVCALPLGVLQRHAASLFSPPLPRQQSEALARLGFGTVNKILLLYERCPLPSGVTEILLCWDDSAESAPKNRPPMQQRWFRRIYSFMLLSDTLLLAWLSGEEAEYAETLSSQEIGRVCTELLSQFLGDPCVPRPKHTVCTSWHSQPYTGGSYTFLPVGSSPADIAAVAQPLCDSSDQARVFFAGEHCHTSFYSTVHGAYLSGEKAADLLIAASHSPPAHHSDNDEQSVSSWLHGIQLS